MSARIETPDTNQILANLTQALKELQKPKAIYPKPYNWQIIPFAQCLINVKSTDDNKTLKTNKTLYKNIRKDDVRLLHLSCSWNMGVFSAQDTTALKFFRPRIYLDHYDIMPNVAFGDTTGTDPDTPIIWDSADFDLDTIIKRDDTLAIELILETQAVQTGFPCLFDVFATISEI